MPIYEYLCKDCECQFEHLKLSAGEGDPPCPSCGSSRVKKLMSAGAVRPDGIPRGSGGFKAPSCAPGG